MLSRIDHSFKALKEAAQNSIMVRIVFTYFDKA